MRAYRLQLQIESTRTQANESKKKKKKPQKSAANYLCFDFFGHDCVFLEKE